MTFREWVLRDWYMDVSALQCAGYEWYPLARDAHTDKSTIEYMQVAWNASEVAARQDAQEWQQAAESYEQLYVATLEKVRALEARLAEVAP